MTDPAKGGDMDSTRAARDAANQNESELPPRDDLVRTSATFELKRTSEDGMPVLSGMAAMFGEWTEIKSAYEGHFFERFMPGSFKKTVSENKSRIRCLFHHGQDPSIGFKPLGPITYLGEDGDGLRYDVQLLDTDYNRALIPGLEAGLYGSSFRFSVVQKDDVRSPKRSAWNPKGILERSVKAASLRELGPTPMPAYAGTSAGIRSLTDEFVLGRFPTETILRRLLNPQDVTRDDIESVSILTQMYELGSSFVQIDGEPFEESRTMSSILDQLRDMIATEPKEDEPEQDPAPSTDAAPTGTPRRRAATTPSNAPLWGMDRDLEEAWRL